MLLKQACSLGFTLFDIGNILYKEEPELESEVEKMLKNALELYDIVKNSKGSQNLDQQATQLVQDQD